MKNKSIFKWFSMLLLMMIVGMSTATAQSLVIDGFSIKAGETKDVAIQLAADQNPIYGVQTDIVLSEGLLLEAKSSAVEGMSFVSNTVSSGAVRVSLLSIAGNTIPEGNVINLTVKASEAFTRGYIQLTNTRLTTSDTGDELKVADVTAAVTLDENGETEYEEVANGTIALEYSQSGFVENFGTLYTPDRMHVGFNDLAITNGSLLSFNGTKEFQGTDGSAISMATIINSSDVKLPVEVNDDNTLSLVWSLKEGYIFEPSKLSFEACRFGTDSGLLTASINCGNQQQVLCEAADVMRSGKGEITKFSFDIYNLVVTSSNSLCLNFSFLSLGMNKEMGLANIVIEGKLLKSKDVVTEPDPQTYTATFDFADPNFRENIGTSMTDPNGFVYNDTFTAENVTLQITAGAAPSRIYTDANRGQNLVTYSQYTTLTFKASDGYAITKIDFTAAGNSNINKLTPSSGTVEAMTWTGNAEGVRFLQGGTSYLANAIVTMAAKDGSTTALPAIEYKECANISAFNALNAGEYAKVTLTDAEVIGKSADGYSTVWIQDATGGCWIQYTSLNAKLAENTKVNGYVYVVARLISGNVQMKEAEATLESEITATEISDYSIVEGTLEEVNIATNLNKVVKISGVTLEETSATAGTLTQGDVTIAVSNGTVTANQQLYKIADWEKGKVLNNVTIIAILTGKSTTANQLLPISIVEEGEAEFNTYTATFSTNRGWENVYAYAWSNEADGSVTEFFGSWPGMQIGAGDGAYTLSIEATAAPQYIIFNNGQGGEGNQTEDLAFENGKAYEFNVAVDDVLPIDIQFGPDYNQESIGSYTMTWTAVKDGHEWTLYGFNNNKNTWDYVKCGQAKVDQTATITSPVINAEVKSYIINVDNTRNVNSATLTILSSDGKVMEMDITESFTTGEVVVPVEGQKGDSYVLTINSIAGANGTTQISKITLSDADVTPTHIANTAETAYTVAKAIELVDAAQALSDTVYVKGIVSQVDPFNEQYDNITYWISDDGTTDGQQFECYRGKGLNGAGFTSANYVKVGATVIVKGTMQKYGYTYEFVAGNELVSYTAPEDPFVITSREKPVPASQEFVEGQTYYLYNVGADMFFTAGNDYETRASIGEKGQQVYFVINEETGYYELKNFVPRFNDFRCAFADGPESVWTDNDSRSTRFWTLQQVDESYRISNTEIEPSFFLGWNGNATDTRLYLMDSQDANVSWKLVSLNDYEIYAYLLQVYNVAEQLKAKIEQAQEMGLDVAAEQAVYDNLSSTIDEMQECINALADRMANNASGTNPVDVTAKYIVNPSYDANDANGWSGTKPYFQRYQNAEFYNKTFDMYQYLSGLAPGVYKLGLQAYYRPGYIDNAYESWKSASNLFAELYVEQFGERDILPLMNIMDGSVTERFGVGSENSVNDNGVSRYVPNDMQSANTYFNAGLYQNNLFFVVNETGDVRIGLSKYELIQSDWTMFDNWTLTYYGNGDDSYLAWVQAVADAAPTFEGVTVTQSVLNEYLAVRNAPVANSKEEAEAYVERLNALKAAVLENSALWTQYETLVAEGQTLANQLQEEGKTNSQEYEDLNDYVTASFGPGEYENYASNGSASYIIGALAMDNATLETEMAYLNELMDAAKYLAPQEGDDVTRYLVNADFSEGQTGWNGFGSATGGGMAGRMPTTGGSPNICAESYDANNFDLYQEVTGSVPVGVYEISVQGFTRIGRNDGYPKGMAWHQFQETGGKQKMPVYVYFNDNATNFMDVHEQPQMRDFYTDETIARLFDNGVHNGTHLDSLSNEGYYPEFFADEALFFPNSMTGASYAFSKGLYVNSAFGAVVNQGDPIRIGVKGSTNGQNWSIYDNFKLTFWGLRADKVLLALQAGIADVEALNAGLIGKNVVDRINNALAAAKKAAEEQSNDGEAMFATLGELYAAKAAVQASQELMDQLAAANDSLQEAVSAANLPNLLRNANAFRQEIATRLNNNDINDDEVPELLAQIRQWLYDISKFVELQEWTDRLNEAQPTDQELEDGLVSYSWLSEWEPLCANLDIMLNPQTDDEAVKVEQVDGLIEQIRQVIDTKYGEKVWTIAGYQDVLGSDWNPEDSSNDMVKLGNGMFQLEKKRVQLYEYVGYEFKVVANHSWDENYGMYGEAGGENCYFYVDEDGLYNVTFIWNYENRELYAITEKATQVWDNTNYMYANNGQVLQKGATSQLAISMQNEESVVAFQFDVVLPDGMSLAYSIDEDFEEVPVLKYTNRALSTHVIATEYQNDGSLRIIGYSSKNAAYRYNDGELLNIGIYVSDWVADGTYTVMLKNVLITNADGVEKHADDRIFTIKVGGVKGDANNDGQVTMSDVVAIVNYVLARPSDNFNLYNADVNNSGDISMADVVGVVNIVLGRTVAGSRGAESTSALVPGTLTLKAEADRMSVKLDNTAAYTAFQMDVTLPEGMSLNDAAFTGRQTSSHSLLMSELENGKVRIAGWSASNAELKGNSGELLSLVLAGAQTVGTVTIDNIRFVTAEGIEHAFAGVEAFGETTGIGLTPALSEGEGVVYDLQGRKVNSKTLKGLYILDGKKIVKK